MVRLAVIAAIITLALMIFSIIDCSRTAENNIRSLPKWAWLVIIIFVPAIGSLAWIIAGRPKGNGRGRRKRKIVPPDDNPDFLG
ncbi:MAG: PLDc N-terminal domain-containing protein, partial [Candidatus Nanopelagicaceae bacterium]